MDGKNYGSLRIDHHQSGIPQAVIVIILTIKTDFNLIPLELTVRDLVALTKAIEDDELNYSASGFFFGRSNNPSDDAFSDQKEDDFDAIKKALDAMADGFIVYYNSWW